MSLLDVARKDFLDAIRSRALWVATTVFLALLFVSILLPAVVLSDPDPGEIVSFMQGPATTLVLPLLGIMVGYRSIVGERERGSIAVLLSLPLSRRDIFLGTLLGRSSVLAVAIVGGIAATTLVVTALYGIPPVKNVIGFAAVTVLLGTTVTAIAVGTSAVATTRAQAISVLTGGYVLATLLWERIPAGAYYLLEGSFPGPDPPWWVQLSTQLNPIEAYNTAAILVLPESPRLAFDVDGSEMAAEQQAVVSVPDSAYAFYDGWFVVAVLLAWILVPTVVGYLRFRNADLD